jgi:hypothetical protein
MYAPGPTAREEDRVRRDSVQALIFDLDETLVDTVYAHVFAWQRALGEAGMPVEGWRIHRRIGMSGGLHLARGRARARTPARRGGGGGDPGASQRALPDAPPGAPAAAGRRRAPRRAQSLWRPARDRDVRPTARDRRLAHRARRRRRCRRRRPWRRAPREARAGSLPGLQRAPRCGARRVLRRRRRRLGPARGALRSHAQRRPSQRRLRRGRAHARRRLPRVYRDAQELHASLDELGLVP